MDVAQQQQGGLPMVQLIVGKKGKGKTKQLLNKVNDEIKSTSGSIVYLDKSNKHMFELNNKVRLIDVCSFFIDNFDEFFGFVSGIISQDNDLQQMYFDNFLEISGIGDGGDYVEPIHRLEKIGEKYQIDFVLSVSSDISEVPDELKDKVIISL